MRQLQERYISKKQKLYHLFIDLEKAFDRVPRQCIQWALRRQLVPEKLIELVMSTYCQTTTSVNTSYGHTPEFGINVGVHQGSILSPLLFITVVEEVTKLIRSNNCFELIYADDIVISCSSENELREKFFSWHQQLSKHGLKINILKTKVMITGEKPEPQVKGIWPCSVCLTGVGANAIMCTRCQKWCHKRCSKVKGTLTSVAATFICPSCTLPRQIVSTSGHLADTDLEIVHEFKYLGDVLSCTGDVETAVRNRLKATWNNWHILASTMMRRDIPLKLRLSLYQSVIRPCMLYGAESWPMTQSIEQQIRRTDLKMLRWM